MTPPMQRTLPPRIERGIARCRLMLSLLTITVLLIDPTRPQLPPWLETGSGFFGIPILTMAVLGAHLAYSTVLYWLARGRVRFPQLTAGSAWTDIIFAGAVGFATEGVRSPFFVFFTFALVALALRAGFHHIIRLTAIGGVLYLGLIMISDPRNIDVPVMLTVYLGIIGYLVAYLGQQRLTLEGEIAELATMEQSTRIARELHDGCVQTLAGVNLKLATCAELLRRGRSEDVLEKIDALRVQVNGEHDTLRAYMQSLAEGRTRGDPAPREMQEPVGTSTAAPASAAVQEGTQVSVNLIFAASARLADEALQIIREGIRNVRVHAQARSARVRARSEGAQLVVTIDDDGVGFANDTERPWTILSRVRELGGALEVKHSGSPGAHLKINLVQGNVSDARPEGALGDTPIGGRLPKRARA